MSAPIEDDEPTAKVVSEIGPWAMVPAWVLTKGLSGAELAVYVSLRSFADREGGCFPKARTIAERANVKIGTCRNAIQSLRRKKLMETTEIYRKDGSLAGLQYRMFDIDPNPGKQDPEDEQSSSDTPTPDGAGGYIGDQVPVHQMVEGGTPDDAGPSTVRLMQEHPNHHPKEDHSVPPSEVRPAAAEDASTSTVQSALIGEDKNLSPKEPTHRDVAMGIARGWIGKWNEANMPMIMRGKKSDPMHAIASSLIPALESGYTDIEVKFALMYLNEPFPAAAALTRALVRVRSGWRPAKDWRVGAPPAAQTRNGRTSVVDVNEAWADKAPQYAKAGSGGDGW